MYFQKFQKTLYDPLKTKSFKECVNIFNSIMVQYRPADNIVLFYNEMIPDGYKIEHMAKEYYGSVDYVWMIILMNNIVNPYYDWPLTNAEFDSFIIDKYGSREGIHHFINLDTGDQVDDVDDKQYRYDIDHNIALPHLIQVVSNYEYEFELNEEKRYIKILNKKYVKPLAEQFEKLMKLK